MRRLLTILLVIAGLPAAAQQADSLFVSFPEVIEGKSIEEEAIPDEPKTLQKPLSIGLVSGLGATKFPGEEKNTFGGGPLFVMDGQVAYGRLRAGLGLGASGGRLLEDYYYKGLWPQGENYSHAHLYGTLGWDLFGKGRFRLTPYAGYGVRMLSYTYYYGYDDEDDPDLSWSRNGPCLFLGLETSLRFLGGRDAGIGLFGRVYASRAGFPGMNANSWAIHFAIGLDLFASFSDDE